MRKVGAENRRAAEAVAQCWMFLGRASPGARIIGKRELEML